MPGSKGCASWVSPGPPGQSRDRVHSWSGPAFISDQLVTGHTNEACHERLRYLCSCTVHHESVYYTIASCPADMTEDVVLHVFPWRQISG